jgi:hypothetical protein
MLFPGQTRSDFAWSTGKGCGPLRLEAPGGGNRDARCIMPCTNFSERRLAEVQLRRITLPRTRVNTPQNTPFARCAGHSSGDMMVSLRGLA